MTGNAVMLAGDWVYDDSARELYDCDALEHKKDQSEAEKQVIKAVNMLVARQRVFYCVPSCR